MVTVPQALGRQAAAELWAHDTQRLASGPTWMPHANLVLGAAALREDGRLRDDVFARVCQTYRDSMVWQAEALWAACAGTPLEDLLHTTMAIYERHLAAVDLLWEDRARGQQALEEAARALDDDATRYADLEEEQSRVRCVRCGESMPAAARTCNACGTKAIPTAQPGGIFEVDESGHGLAPNLQLLLEAAR